MWAQTVADLETYLLLHSIVRTVIFELSLGAARRMLFCRAVLPTIVGRWHSFAPWHLVAFRVVAPMRIFFAPTASWSFLIALSVAAVVALHPGCEQRMTYTQ